MKSAYLIYALLCVTLVLAVEGTIQSETISSTEPLNNSHSESITKGTTAVPLNVTDNPVISNSSSTNSTTPTPTNATTITIPTTTDNTTTPITTTVTTTIVTPSTTTPATTLPTSTTSKTTSHVSPTSPPTSTSTASSKTTAVPPSSKDRHFDGLSFFGGIILTTCLMAIAAFSWKFYRQCKEGNYRTL